MRCGEGEMVRGCLCFLGLGCVVLSLSCFLGDRV